MELRERQGGEAALSLSLDQVKRIYTALFCKLQTGGCGSFDDLENDDMLLTLQKYLQKQAASEGVDCTDHAAWERFLGIRHPQSCPRKSSRRPDDARRTRES